MRKRTYDGVVTQKPSRKSDKKVCDLGRACPYQEEYQHLMEFSHDCAPAAQRAPQRPFNAFGGTGVRLGSTGGGNYPANHRQNSPPWEDAICCEFCSRKIPIHLIQTHLASHNGNQSQNSIKRDQDSEYEQSVIEDIQRQSEVEAKRKDEELRQLQEKEAAQLEEVLRTSILASNKAKREQAIQELQSEPGPDYEGDKITLKFTLPKGTKLKRTFRATRSVQDAFTFLRTMEELEGLQYTLRDAVNTVVLEASDARTFQEASVRSNTSLLVVETGGGSTAQSNISAARPSSAAPVSGPLAESSSSAGRRSASNSSGGSGASVEGGEREASDSVIVLDDSLLEVTPKVRRKASAAGGAMSDVHADVIDLTFS